MFPASSMPDADWWTTLWPNPREVLSKILPPNVHKRNVLDLCCGNGYFTLPLVDFGDKCYGLELDKSLLDEAKVNAEKDLHLSEKCVFQEGNAMELSSMFPAGHFDCILLANTLHGIPDKEGILKQMALVLSDDSPDSEIIIINWYNHMPREECIVLNKPRGPPDTMRMSIEDVQRLAESCGLQVHNIVHNVSPFHYAISLTKQPVSSNENK